MIIGEGPIGRLHVGSVGVISRSEVHGDQRVYHIEFAAEAETVITPLPNPDCIQLITSDDTP